MIADIRTYVDWNELIWFVITSMTFGINCIALVAAVTDYKMVKRLGINNGVLIVAKAHMRREAIRVIDVSFLVAAGVVELTSRNEYRPGHEVVVFFLLLAFLILLCAQSIMDWLVRQHLIEVALAPPHSEGGGDA